MALNWQDYVILTPFLTPSRITRETGWLSPHYLILKQEIFFPLSLHKAEKTHRDSHVVLVCWGFFWCSVTELPKRLWLFVSQS